MPNSNLETGPYRSCFRAYHKRLPKSVLANKKETILNSDKCKRGRDKDSDGNTELNGKESALTSELVEKA